VDAPTGAVVVVAADTTATNQLTRNPQETNVKGAPGTGSARLLRFEEGWKAVFSPQSSVIFACRGELQVFCAERHRRLSG
jgi:hypothetical protein